MEELRIKWVPSEDERVSLSVGEEMKARGWTEEEMWEKMTNETFRRRQLWERRMRAKKLVRRIGEEWDGMCEEARMYMTNRVKWMVMTGVVDEEMEEELRGRIDVGEIRRRLNVKPTYGWESPRVGAVLPKGKIKI